MRKVLVNIPYGTILLILLASVALEYDARAAAVSNMDEKDHTIEVRVAGEFKPQIIKAGETWRIDGAAMVKYSGSETWIDFNQEFAIWKGGVFGPQKINIKNKGKS